MPLTIPERTPWQHAFKPEHRDIIAKELAPTIAEWLRANRVTYYRPYDFDRLIWVDNDTAERCGDPDRDFAQSATRALNIAEKNVEILHRAMAAERRRGVANRWNYCVSRHAQLVRAHTAENLILVWITRVIAIRSGVPSIGAPEAAHA